MVIPRPRYFRLREVRFGPLVPARLWWDDADPADPDNKLDRGNLVPYPRADIAGIEIEPQRLFDRLGIHPDSRIRTLEDFEKALAEAVPPLPSHWKYAEPISKARYEWMLAALRHAERHRPEVPELRPRRAVTAAQVAIPDFERENR